MMGPIVRNCICVQANMYARFEGPFENLYRSLNAYYSKCCMNPSLRSGLVPGKFSDLSL